MSHDAFDMPSQARPVEGEVAAAAADAQKVIDLDDPDAVEVWAERFGVSVQAVRRAVLEGGPTVEAVSSRLKAARDAAD